MTRWRNICCAVDFYAPSWMAMEHAAAMARRFGAELTLVHVIAPPLRGVSEAFAAGGTSRREVEVEDRERLLKRWASDASFRAGRPVRARVLSGDPAAALLQYAREAPCDLFVVGARGPMGMTRVLMGSLAGRLSRKSPCPVIVVHDHERREKGGEAEGVQHWQ